MLDMMHANLEYYWTGQQTDKISTFKTTLLRTIPPKEKNIFNVRNHDLRCLYQLRVGSGPLTTHKRRHNFLDTPNDPCMCESGAEKTAYFALLPIFQQAHEETNGLN